MNPPQYHRGGASPAESLRQTSPVPPVSEWSPPPTQSEQPSSLNTGEALRSPTSDPYPPQQATPVSRRGETGETYGYDYRYADGMDDYYVQSNPAGWLALVLAVLGAVMAWDRLGAVIALGVLTVSFITGLIALSLRGRRKWYAWIAVWLSVLAGLFALVSVIVSLIALMGGFSFSGEASFLGVIDLPPVHIARIQEVTLSFPASGLSYLKLG